MKSSFKSVREVLDLARSLEQPYSFEAQAGSKTVLVRDLLGIMPLFYSIKGKDLRMSRKRFPGSSELDPQTALVFDRKTGKVRKIRRRFYPVKPVHSKPPAVIRQKLEELLVKAVEKRLPDEDFGILFSGGVDSSFIAAVCKSLGKSPVLYTVVVSDSSIAEAEDLSYAKKTAKALGLRLKVIRLSLKQVEALAQETVVMLQEASVVKTGVAVPVLAACRRARKDGIRFMFSGLGSEEIFAGYERHKLSEDINKECVKGLKQMHERDTYRDYLMSSSCRVRLLLPFLDNDVVRYSLRIPGILKLGRHDKQVFRQVAERYLPKTIAYRKKRAAQYGSRSDKALKRLASRNGFRLRKRYLEQFLPFPRLGALVSGGKDSIYAAYLMKKQGFPLGCIINMRSLNPDSYMFHTPAISMVSFQAEAMGIPLFSFETKGEKEKELKDLEKALKKAVERYGIQGITTGALYSTYQKERIEKLARKLGLKVFSPLWHMDQEKLMRDILGQGFDIMLTAVACEGLDSTWLGRSMTFKDIDRLVNLNDRIGINIAFEGGEAESLVLDCPLFSKKISIRNSRVEMENSCTGRLVVEDASLVSKGAKKPKSL
ncbi:diphthine--ammonia ligase [Candidatus Woesearchaeota archaeon]|nr:diphthine--ammonia ligase [Candidatus Woesearchaeota archaeon]